MTPEATVLVPTHDHGALLRVSVESALDQTVPVEVFIVGDGATEETRAVAAQLTLESTRVRFFDNPKGPRHGEAYRHAALQEARGRVVCYLADDDLYVKTHVEEMCERLTGADFAHAFAIRVVPNEGLSAWTVDLSIDTYRRELLAGRNRVPLSAGAHTMEMYRRLAEGWTNAPPDLASDLHMWQKFLRHPECRFAAGCRPTVYVFPSPLRHHLTISERVRELQEWRGRLSLPASAAGLEREVLNFKRREAAELEGRILDAPARGPAKALFQVFFPNEGGYTERESTFRELRIGPWEEFVMELPATDSSDPLRIDPSNTPGIVEFAILDLRDSDGRPVWQLNEGNAPDLCLFREITRPAPGSLLLISQGNDPQLHLPVKLPRGQKLSLQVRVRLSADVSEMALAVRN